MREILFRGQIRRYGEKVRIGDGFKLPSLWVYGGVLQGIGSHSVIYGGGNENDPSEGLEKWVVYTDTLGQFTGLTDKNGKKVFEGDIFATKFNKGLITFDDDRATFGFQIWWKGFPDDFATFKEFGKPEFEIIGNIYDNPERLKKK